MPADPVSEPPAPEAEPAAELVARLTTVDAVVVAPDAVETAEWVAELAVDTTGPAVDVAVDAADWTGEEATLVALETTGGGEGTDTDGTPEADGVLTDGLEEEGSPEARLADAPDPMMAASASVRAQTAISGLACFMDVDLFTLKALTRGGARTFCARNRTFLARRRLELRAPFRLPSCSSPVRLRSASPAALASWVRSHSSWLQDHLSP